MRRACSLQERTPAPGGLNAPWLKFRLNVNDRLYIFVGAAQAPGTFWC